MRKLVATLILVACGDQEATIKTRDAFERMAEIKRLSCHEGIGYVTCSGMQHGKPVQYECMESSCRWVMR